MGIEPIAYGTTTRHSTIWVITALDFPNKIKYNWLNKKSIEIYEEKWK